MSVLDNNAVDLNPHISEAEVGDYIALLKPRVMSLVIFTALVGMAMAPGHFHPVLAFTSLSMIPALLFFSLFERRIVGGLTGAVKG